MLRSVVQDVETVSYVPSINFSIWCLLLLRSFHLLGIVSRNRDHSCEQGMCREEGNFFPSEESLDDVVDCLLVIVYNGR
jgi:hypothetical protein